MCGSQGRKDGNANLFLLLENSFNIYTLLMMGEQYHLGKRKCIAVSIHILIYRQLNACLMCVDIPFSLPSPRWFYEVFSYRKTTRIIGTNSGPNSFLHDGKNGLLWGKITSYYVGLKNLGRIPFCPPLLGL